MSEKRCIICNKPYEYHYSMFGRGCLDNLFELLGITKPFRIFNKENYLCTQIAWKNHKFFLNKSKKQELAKKYIALNYLKKINYNALEDIKEKIRNDIKSISVFSKDITNTVPFTLNEIYKLYNTWKKFEDIIEEIKKINWEEVDQKVAEEFIKSLSFIFDKTKKANPISYAVFYSMQYTFWQVVVVGGMLTNNKLSAKLLSNSLTLFDKEPEDLTIEDKGIANDVMKSETFKKYLKNLIKKYGEDFNEICINENSIREDTLISFTSGDLLYALHDATIYINIIRNEDESLKIDGEIIDTYDFTDFKDLKEYIDSNETTKKLLNDLFSTLLNNFGVVSYEYGVIKKFDVKIKFKDETYRF